VKSCSNGKFTMKLSASIPNLKSQAKRKAKEQGIPLSEALNEIAQREGFNSWSLLAKKFEEYETAQRQTLPKTIVELPLTGLLRKEAVSTAKSAFAKALGRMEARNPRTARSSWNAEEYVDRVLTSDMLPIETDYALSLFEAFIVMEAVDAAVDADAED
jgi:hypothetical protein